MKWKRSVFRLVENIVINFTFVESSGPRFGISFGRLDADRVRLEEVGHRISNIFEKSGLSGIDVLWKARFQLRFAHQRSTGSAINKTIIKPKLYFYNNCIFNKKKNIQIILHQLLIIIIVYSYTSPTRPGAELAWSIPCLT